MKATIKALSSDGFEITFETPDVTDREKLLATLADFKDQLLEDGYSPIPSAPTAAPVVVTAPASVTMPAGLQFFPVSRISAIVDDDKVFWRVKGGAFEKFGVTIYPEVLEAADLKLDPYKSYTEAGMIAWYSLKEGTNKPKKVVRLERNR